MLNRTPKTSLTLSAVPEHHAQVDRTPAALHRAAICSGCGRAIFRVGTGWAHVINPADDPTPIPDTELRALWGDR